MAAGVTIVLILVGLPLLAWWVGGRAFWSRLRPRAFSDPWRDLVQQHRLSAADASRVATAVPRGLQFDAAHLRPAAVDWAERLLDQETLRWPRTLTGRIGAGLAVLWACGVIGFLLHSVLSGRPEDVNWSTVALYVGLGVWLLRRRRNLRRAVERNQDEPATA